MQLPISEDKLTIGPFTANTIDGIFYIKPTANTASLTLYYGILPGGEKMIKHDKVISIDDTDALEAEIAELEALEPDEDDPSRSMEE